MVVPQMYEIFPNNPPIPTAISIIATKQQAVPARTCVHSNPNRRVFKTPFPGKTFCYCTKYDNANLYIIYYMKTTNL